jgi:hypothetical protein
VFGGIFGGGGAALGGSGAGAAAVAFLGFGIFGVVHLLSELSVKGGVRGFQKIWGKLLKVSEKIFWQKL